MKPLWTDGRSGAAGCLAGNLVLAHLRTTEGEVFEARKGTTFRGRATLWVGRVCATDAYLNARDRHWANLSLAQHDEVMSEAKLEAMRVKYLFITALMDPPSVHYWAIPGEVIERIGFASNRADPDFVFALHIRENNGRFEVEGEDVTRFHRVLELTPSDVTRLDAGFRAARQARTRRELRESGDRRAHSLRTTGQGRHGDFQIPLNGGRSAVLSVPLPAGETDLQRIKGWIDLMSDVLTEPLESSAERDAQPASGEDIVRTLQRRSASLGNDRLSDEDVEAEIRATRRERRR